MANNLIPHVCLFDSPYDIRSGSCSCRISFTGSLYLNGTIKNFTLKLIVKVYVIPFILDTINVTIVVVFVVSPLSSSSILIEVLTSMLMCHWCTILAKDLFLRK